MRLAEKKDYDNLIEFLKSDIPDCLFIYADLMTMGLDKPELTFWISEKNDKIMNVAMKYYSSFQLFGDFDDSDFQWLAETMKENNIDRVSSKDTDIKRMKSFFSSDFSDHYGVIFSYEKSPQIDYKGIVEEASFDDIDGIAELIMTDKELSASYTSDELKSQLYDRMKNNTGRSFIIKEDGRIVGHICFLIETDIFCVSGWLIVHPEHRDLRTVLRLQYAVYDETNRCGKDHYFFIDQQPRRVKMFEGMGNKVVARYGKLIKE